MIEQYLGRDAAEQAAMHVLWDYNRMVNHALDRVWIVGTCLGAILRSMVTWRYDRP